MMVIVSHAETTGDLTLRKVSVKIQCADHQTMWLDKVYAYHAQISKVYHLMEEIAFLATVINQAIFGMWPLLSMEEEDQNAWIMVFVKIAHNIQGWSPKETSKLLEDNARDQHVVTTKLWLFMVLVHHAHHAKDLMPPELNV